MNATTINLDIAKLISVGITIAVFLLFFLLINKAFKRLVAKQNRLPVKFLNSAVNTIVIVIFLYSILSEFEVTKEISSTLLKSGTLIIALLTFAAQQALGNVISGFSISVFRPLEIGQKVQVKQGSSIIAEGIVRDMTIRNVVIESPDGKSYIIPNSVIDQSIIVNSNFTENVGNFLEFEIAYNADIALAKKLIIEACHAEELILPEKRDPAIYTSAITANGTVLKFSVWTETLDDSFRACSNLREKLVTQFLQNGIEIPYNTMDVHIN